MSRTPRSYADLIEFALKNPSLTRTNVITEFRKQGGKAQKQAGLKALDEYFEVEKGSKRTLNIRELISGKKDKKTPIDKVLPKGKNKSKFDVTDKITYSENSAQHLLSRMDKLYGQKIRDMFAVSVRIVNDDFTFKTKRDFRFFIPYIDIGKDKNIPVKKFFKAFISQASAFYHNLQNEYDGEYQAVLQDFNQAKKEINRTTYLSKEKAIDIFENYGISITGIEHITYK